MADRSWEEWALRSITTPHVHPSNIHRRPTDVDGGLTTDYRTSFGREFRNILCERIKKELLESRGVSKRQGKHAQGLPGFGQQALLLPPFSFTDWTASEVTSLQKSNATQVNMWSVPAPGLVRQAIDRSDRNLAQVAADRVAPPQSLHRSDSACKGPGHVVFCRDKITCTLTSSNVLRLFAHFTAKFPCSLLMPRRQPFRGSFRRFSQGRLLRSDGLCFCLFWLLFTGLVQLFHPRHKQIRACTCPKPQVLHHLAFASACIICSPPALLPISFISLHLVSHLPVETGVQYNSLARVKKSAD